MADALKALLERHNMTDPEVEGDFPIDENVLTKFPAGSKIVSANRYGISAWTITARLNVMFPDGSMDRFFMKCAAGERGLRMMQGEYNGITEIYETLPTIVPKPHAWDPEKLCSKLATLHRNSISPNGKFGFHITTCQGQIPQMTGTWETRWEDLFVKLLKHVVNLDFETNGHWVELDLLEQRIFSQVIPKLIGNFERDGRSVKPSLIHGDLWEGNTGTSLETGEVCIFDCGAFYTDNEMEIGDWRYHYNKIHEEVCTRTYLRHYDPSEPRKEWDDRNRMYCIYYNIIYSVNHLSKGKAVRQTAFDDMYYLIDKYAPFTAGEGPDRLRESERVGLSAERDHIVG